jgi:hypothetical protein
MRFDWDEIKYQWNDLRQRPEVRKRLAVGGTIAILAVIVGAFFLSLTWVRTEPKPSGGKGSTGGGFERAPERPAYRGAKEFAQEVSRKLAADSRFQGIAVVPTVSARDGQAGRVMLMGQIPRADIEVLRSLIAGLNPPVAVDWQITAP